MNSYIPALGIRILIAKICRRWRGIFKELQQVGGLTNFCALLFNDDLSNEPIVTVSQVHLT
jgi:hypothetical protein